MTALEEWKRTRVILSYMETFVKDSFLSQQILVKCVICGKSLYRLHNRSMLTKICSSTNPMRAFISSIVSSDRSQSTEKNLDHPDLLESLHEVDSSRSADFGESIYCFLCVKHLYGLTQLVHAY